MITLIIDDTTHVELSAEAQIAMELPDPLYSTSLVQRGYSFPFSLPLSDHNRKTFGYPELLDSTSNFSRSYACKIYADTLLMFVGRLYLSKIEGGMIQAYVVAQSQEATVFDTPLRDIYMGEPVSFDYAGTGPNPDLRDHAKLSLDGDADTWDYVFTPVLNPAFYEGIDQFDANPLPHKYCGVMNMWDFQKQEFWDVPTDNSIAFDNVLSSYTSTPPATISTFVPFPYLLAVMRYAAQHMGYTLTGSWTQDGAIKRLVIYNNTSLDVLRLINTIFVVHRNIGDADLDLRNHVPNISIKDLFDAVKTLFRLTMIVDEDRKTIIIEPAADAPKDYTLDLSPHAGQPISIEKPTQGNDGYLYEMLLHEADHIQAPLKDVAIGGANVLLDDVPNSFPVSDPVGSVRFFIDTCEDRKKLTPFVSKGWNLSNAAKYRIGIGGTVISAKVGTVPVEKKTIPFTDYPRGKVEGATPIQYNNPITYLSGIIPSVSHRGNSEPYFGTDRQEVPFRLMFYAGKFTDPNGFGDYPIATSNIYDDQGNIILPYSLKWLGSSGALYPRWHRPVQDLYTGNVVHFPIRLTLPLYQQLQPGQTYKIGNQRYKLRKLSFTLTHAGFGSAKAECVRL